MKSLVILSGKGGAGKTTVTASLAYFAAQSALRVAMADLDVDAANLDLLLSPQHQSTQPFFAGHKAQIDPQTCISCGQCVEHCRFLAIDSRTPPTVDIFACEGCGVCALVCPAQAISFREPLCGHWHISRTSFGPLVHADLLPGAENSGKLVSLVKTKALELSQQEQADILLLDGPPGVGCPVIASISGADGILLVTEPSLSGLSDLERVVALAVHFRVPIVGVCINKADLHAGLTERIGAFADQHHLPWIATIPYDEQVIQALVAGLPPARISDSPAARELKALWKTLYSTFLAPPVV